MGVFDRFFGRGGKDRSGEGGASRPANPALENPLSLQVLFPTAPAWDAAAMAASLRAYHPDLAAATFEIDPQAAAQGTPIGLAGWGEQVVQVVGFNVPMPAEAVERCVQPAHYGPNLKAQARAHQAHALLYYAGYDEDPLEQYVALAAVAGSLAAHGAVVVTNEAAHTSFPAEALSPDPELGDMMDLLRTLPPLALYCGFVKYEVEGVRGVWMRTHGNPLLGLPDLATLAEGHHRGEETFDIFNSTMEYLRTSGAEFEAGHTMQVGEDVFMRLRAPRREEYFLDSPGELFVAEFITEDEINRGR